MPVPGSAMPVVPAFKVLKLLGKGSYGKVYKVERESDGQVYAMKETDLGAMSQTERMDAVNEVRLLVSIGHANVIRYHEAFLNGHKLCVVMEYAPFGDLTYYINKGKKMKAPFPEEAIWRIFLQLCRGLEALHSRQVIHRDIKPANIFLCQRDLLKIGDLGIAKALTHMQLARTQIGTPCYMAPEVWAGKAYSYSSDLWSLGAVLYEMMTFHTPMEGRHIQELKSKIIAGRFTPIPPGQYSPELTSFCHTLLSPQPLKRPTLDAILSSSAAAKWFRILPAAPPARRISDPGCKAALLDTIQVPRDLRLLPRKLPPPSYDSDILAAQLSAPSASSRPPLVPIQQGGGGPAYPSSSALPPIGLARQSSWGCSVGVEAPGRARPLSAPRSRLPCGLQRVASEGCAAPLRLSEPPFMRPPPRRSVYA